jgi:hypothetical protein
MRRSFLIYLGALAVIILTACSTAQPPKPAPPPFLARSATLAITNGIKVLTTVALPTGFAPIASRPPIWLQNSNEIAVVGTQGGHTVVYGLGGPGWRSGRILAAEDGEGAIEPGTIVDVAASPEGLALATAIVPHDGKRVDVVVRDLIATGSGSIMASFEGEYDSISMSWLNSATIALALRKHPETSAPPPSEDPDAPPPPIPADGLQVIVVTGASSVAPLKLDCAMSRIRWSTHGVYGVAEGDSGAPAAIIDRRKSTCTKFRPASQIEVLDWNTDEEGSFLYAAPDPSQHTLGVFRYNIETGEQHLVAISTRAASFTGGGEIIAVGNQHLTSRIALEHPDQPILAQVAISQPEQSQVNIKPLGFQTTPAMLTQSTMTYSKGSDEAAMQVYSPSLPIPWRKIVTYSVQTDSAFLLAAGPAQGTVTMAWSNKGRLLAILDGDQNVTTMTVLAPPR